jgi:sigma-B regulation protein RsbU (phosphoserine phosphatase)
MLIGVDMDSQYEDAKIQLYPGDTIIYYTDGFTDAVNPIGDRLDEAGLVEAFQQACLQCRTSQEILDYLFERVDRFVGEENDRGDDMTLVVMRVQSSE